MKLISLNIEYDKHFDTIFPLFEKEQADIICLQEVPEEHVSHIQEKLGMQGVFQFSAYIGSTLPHYKDNYGKRQGVAIFAKKILRSGYALYTGDENGLHISFDEYAAKGEQEKIHLLLYADVEGTNGEEYRCVTTHFPISKEGAATERQLQALDTLFEKLDPLGEFILCGDFNAARGNETFTRLAKKYTDNIPLHYKTSIDQLLHRKQGIMFMVDGLFTTKEYQASNVSLVDGVSDHMAIVGTVMKR